MPDHFCMNYLESDWSVSVQIPAVSLQEAFLHLVVVQNVHDKYDDLSWPLKDPLADFTFLLFQDKIREGLFN
jgi:hypothetical protein